MVQVQEGDVLVFSSAGVVRHFDSNLNFIQIKYILTQEEYNSWFNGEVGGDGTRMGVQVGNYIYTANFRHKSVGILDLELNRVDTFLVNPYGGDVSCLAYDSVNDILYVATTDDYDIFSTRICLAAYNNTTRQLLWRKPSTYEQSSILIGGERAIRAVEAWIALTPDNANIVFTDNGYGTVIGNAQANISPTPLHYLDAIQPVYFDDRINTSYPPGAFPDTTQLVYQPGPPHTIQVVTDGTEGPVNQGVVATEGNKLNTTGFFGFFGVNQPDRVHGQVVTRARAVATGPDGKIYVMVEQASANQNRDINNYPTSPTLYFIMESYYSAEPHIEILNSDGTYNSRISLPVRNTETSDENHHRQGYLFGGLGGSLYGTNTPFSVSIDKAGEFAWTAQTGIVSTAKGAGPVTRINLTTGEVLYKGDIEIVPRWAIEQLNDGLFRESTTPSYRHVLPITFASLVKYPGIAKVPMIGTVQEWFARTTP